MICFDLEGPLSPQDNAYEVMSLSETGRLVFEALSEYDDFLALENRPGYEPGDTLKLIVPFLSYYGITEYDIGRVSEGAVLVSGMKDVVEWLRSLGERVRIISTSYEQHAHSVGRQLGVDSGDIASTRLVLGELTFDSDVREDLRQIEKKILDEGLSSDVTAMLDELYFGSGLFQQIGVEVVGGQRKVDALLRFAAEVGEDISSVVAIGDSITDYKMLREVSGAGGLAIAFNANKYCLPYADVAVATLDGRAVLPIIEAFKSGGRGGALQKAAELESDPAELESGYGYLLEMEIRPVYSVIAENKDLKEILAVHRDMRMRVRGEAGKLG
ncbi:phosphoserine phosphatase [archaeon BMS3Abin16]|nr:phosphoserine phosphatase [archaeon BMS3Abin16]